MATKKQHSCGFGCAWADQRIVELEKERDEALRRAEGYKEVAISEWNNKYPRTDGTIQEIIDAEVDRRLKSEREAKVTEE